MQSPQISNGYFQLWHSYLTMHGHDWHSLNLSTSLSHQLHDILLKPVDSQSDLGFFVALLQQTQQRLRIPNLVLEMAKAVTPAHFGLLGYMASRSATVAEGIDYVLRFGRLVLDGEQMVPIQMQVQNQHIRLFWPMLTAELIPLNELTIAAMVNLARQFVPNEQLFLQGIEMVHSPQMALKHYQHFYPCPVRFAQAEYAIVLSSESLHMRTSDADPMLMQILVKQAEEALAQRQLNQNIVAKLQWIVAEYLRQRQQAPKIEAIAAEMCLSVRTLQRYLKQQHSSFKLILEQARSKRCAQLLAQGCPLAEIAEQLGYSDQSALARAYKQQTGLTLLKHKQQLQQKQQLSQKQQQ